MAKHITKAQLRQLDQAQLFDNDENGEFIGSSVDTDLSDLLDEAGVEVRDDG